MCLCVFQTDENVVFSQRLLGRVESGLETRCWDMRAGDVSGLPTEARRDIFVKLHLSYTVPITWPNSAWPVIRHYLPLLGSICSLHMLASHTSST